MHHFTSLALNSFFWILFKKHSITEQRVQPNRIQNNEIQDMGMWWCLVLFMQLVHGKGEFFLSMIYTNWTNVFGEDAFSIASLPLDLQVRENRLDENNLPICYRAAINHAKTIIWGTSYSLFKSGETQILTSGRFHEYFWEWNWMRYPVKPFQHELLLVNNVFLCFHGNHYVLK